MFVQAAAAKWSVPAGEITVKDSVLTHASGKTAGFGDLLAEAAKVTPPEPGLKDPKTFTLIGTDRVRRKDAQAKSDGTARYTQDVHLPDMLTAVVAHAPRFGGKIKSFDAAEAKKVPGVVDVYEIPTGIAVVAQTTYAARMGREALKVEWDEDKAEKRGSAAIAHVPRHRRRQGSRRPEVGRFRLQGRRGGDRQRQGREGVRDHLRIPLSGPRHHGADELRGHGRRQQGQAGVRLAGPDPGPVGRRQDRRLPCRARSRSRPCSPAARSGAAPTSSPTTPPSAFTSPRRSARAGR
jgi:hypothetical protein